MRTLRPSSCVVWCQVTFYYLCWLLHCVVVCCQFFYIVYGPDEVNCGALGAAVVEAHKLQAFALLQAHRVFVFAVSLMALAARTVSTRRHLSGHGLMHMGVVVLRVACIGLSCYISLFLLPRDGWLLVFCAMISVSTGIIKFAAHKSAWQYNSADNWDVSACLLVQTALPW